MRKSLAKKEKARKQSRLRVLRTLKEIHAAVASTTEF